MVHISRSALLALSVSLAATNVQAGARAVTHVACVGDSITAGGNASTPTAQYPAVLQALLGSGVVVKNFGHSGATLLSRDHGDLPYVEQGTFQSASYFVANAPPGSVVSVVINLGANDSKPHNWSPAGTVNNGQQFLADYRALVDHFLTLPTRPVVYVVLPLATGDSPCCEIRGDIIRDEQVPLIRQLASEKNLPIIDLNTPTQGHPEYFADGVHPNDFGYQVLAELIREGLMRAPSVDVTTPGPGSTLQSPVQLSAHAAAGSASVASVEFFNGVASIGTVAAEPFSLVWPAAAGIHEVSAKATDFTGAWTMSSAVTLTILPENGPAPEGSAGATGASSATKAAKTSSSATCSFSPRRRALGWASVPLLLLTGLVIRRRRSRR